MNKTGEKLSSEELARKRNEMRDLKNSQSEADDRRAKERSASQGKNREKARQASIKRRQKGFFAEWGQYIMIAGAAAAILLVMNWPKYDPSAPTSEAEVPIIEDSLISTHNESDSSYSLGGNKLFDGVSVQEGKKLFHNGIAMQTKNMPKCGPNKDTAALPDNFNWNEKHPECVKSVMDQGLCSSAWAIVSAGVFTDRHCQTTGDTAFRASAQQLLTCEKKQSAGCDRGFILGAMEYGKNKGFVSADCMGYKPYDISVDCNYSEINKCPQKVKVADYCAVDGVDAIKREVMTNGPVASVFPVYRDFLVYRDGVYSPLAAVERLDGHQAVKIVGWGSSGKTQFWWVENSFGEEWGVNGLAQVKIGVHDSQLDRTAVAVTPAPEE